MGGNTSIRADMREAEGADGGRREVEDGRSRLVRLAAADH